MRRKKRNGRVAPVVDQSMRTVLGIELKHRQQLNRCNAQLLKIRNLFDETSVGAGCRGMYTRIGVTSESSHVKFIDHGSGTGSVQRRVPLPVIRIRIDHYTLHGTSGGVPVPTQSFAIVGERHNYCAAIWVQEDFFRIEPHSTGRIQLSMHPVSIELPVRQARNKTMPVVVCAITDRIERENVGRFPIVFTFEEE